MFDRIVKHLPKRRAYFLSHLFGQVPFYTDQEILNWLDGLEIARQKNFYPIGSRGYDFNCTGGCALKSGSNGGTKLFQLERLGEKITSVVVQGADDGTGCAVLGYYDGPYSRLQFVSPFN